MTYTAVLKDEDRLLHIYEGDVYMGYLHDFATVNIAKAFQDAINGVIPLNIASELFAQTDSVIVNDEVYQYIVIGDEEGMFCEVTGTGYDTELRLAVALIKQMQKQDSSVETPKEDESRHD